MTTMIVLFSSVGAHVPAFKKEKREEANVESLVSRLNYRGTSLLIFSMCLMVTCPEWISGTGVNIDCMHGGSIPDSVINNYCYIQGTFIVPRHVSDIDTVPGRDNSQTGVGPYDPLDPKEELRVKAYYQWVPFMLFLQSLMFYTPHLFYKWAEAGKVKNVLGSLNLFVLNRETRSGAEDELAKWFVESLGIHNVWGLTILLAQSLYLINVIGQIVFTDMFLGYEFSTYGVSVAGFLEVESKERADPMSMVFPRVTKCTFHKFGPTGSLQRHDAQCILPINILNEKIYVFLWFWFIFLAILTSLDFLFHVGHASLIGVRRMILSKKLRTVPKFKVDKAKIDLDLICNSLSYGDWQLMYSIILNMGSITFVEWMQLLTERLRDLDDEKLRTSDTVPLISSMQSKIK